MAGLLGGAAQGLGPAQRRLQRNGAAVLRPWRDLVVKLVHWGSVLFLLLPTWSWYTTGGLFCFFWLPTADSYRVDRLRWALWSSFLGDLGRGSRGSRPCRYHFLFWLHLGVARF